MIDSLGKVDLSPILGAATLQAFQLLTVNKERIAVICSQSTKVMSVDPAAASDCVAAAPNLLQQSELINKCDGAGTGHDILLVFGYY